jgi:hypothetical protein
MTYRGRVSGGVVVLPKDAAIPEGTEVTINPVEQQPMPEATGLGKRLMRFAGKAQDLPSDAARNHDHYLYGTPKK